MRKVLSFFFVATLLSLVSLNAQSGKSLDLNGTTQYMKIPHHEDFNIPKGRSFTIAMKIKPRAFGGIIKHNQRFVSKRALNYNQTNQWPEAMMDNRSGYELWGNNNGSTQFFAVNSPSVYGNHDMSMSAWAGGTGLASSWNHIAFVVDRTAGRMFIYLNGQETQSNPSRVITNWEAKSTFDLLVGAVRTYAISEGASYFFDGSIDDLRVWHRALSSEEVATDRSGTLSTEGLKAAYDFEAVSGLTVPDVSGNGHDGTLVGFAPVELETVETPTFEPNASTFVGSTEVTIMSATEGAKIYYTLDGSEPTAMSTEYTAPITLTETTTIKAIAVRAGMTSSAIATATYTRRTPEYCKWEDSDGSRSGNNRVVRVITTSGGMLDGTPQSLEVEVAGISAVRQTSIYFNRLTHVLHVTRGNTVTFHVSKYSLEWMHYYCYIDYDKNGTFDTSGREMAYYSHISTDNEATWRNSKGEIVPSGNQVPSSFSITIPDDAPLGETRIRFKVDWNSLDPCGNRTPGNLLSSNNGTMVDFLIEVHEATTPPPTEEHAVVVDYDDEMVDLSLKNTTKNEAFESGDVVDDGNTIELTAVAKAGHRITSLLVNDVEKIGELVDGRLSLTVTDDLYIEVVSEAIPTYTLFAQLTDGQATYGVRMVDNFIMLGNPAELRAGTEVEIAIDAAEGYEITSLLINGEERLSSLVNHRMRLTIMEDTRIVIVTRAIPQLITLAVETEGDGTVAVVGDDDLAIEPEDRHFPAGTLVRINLTAAEGKMIEGLYVKHPTTHALTPVDVSFDEDNKRKGTAFVQVTETSRILVAKFVADLAVDGIGLEPVRVYGVAGSLVVAGVEPGTTLSVYSLDGKLIDQRTASSSTERIALSQGVYLVRVGAQTTTTHKVQL